LRKIRLSRRADSSVCRTNERPPADRAPLG
jgi:hypothetical protein